MMFNSIREMMEVHNRAVRSQHEARKAGHKEDAKRFRKQAMFLEKRMDKRVKAAKGDSD